MNNPHSELIKQILLESSKYYDFLLLWENNTGTARSMDGYRIIKFGLKGSADIIGICDGKFIAIECKTGKAVQSKDQKNFQDQILKRNGFYFVCRSLHDFCNIIEKIKK